VKNKIKDILISLRICTEGSIYKYYPKTRDRNDIFVLKCKKSGVIFLSQTDHIDILYYQNKQKLNYLSAKNIEETKKDAYKDDKRRARQFKQFILNKKWMDFGTGAGGVLDLLSPIAREVYAVELQYNLRKMLKKIGYKVYANLNEFPEKDFEVITLFHVLEHLTEPIKTLSSIHGKLAEKGKIIIEIPHANDFLLSQFNLTSFKNFTFWSEHLILHTKESLRIFLQTAGFKNINIIGYQRYSLANHLHWLIKGKPDGHKKWKFLDNRILNKAYTGLLKKINKTDTLIAIAEK